MLVLRPDQIQLNDAITNAQAAGAINVLAQGPTGFGKTVVMAHRNWTHQGASVNIAHRQELISQMSLALARFGLRHRIVAAKHVIRQCVSIHMMETGKSFYDPLGRVGVAGVDTLVRRPPDDPWFRSITLWQTDEAHHLLKNNKWGKACDLFKNARGIGWTATPGRSDGNGLGRHSDGVMDALVMGPDMRWLIEQGHLCDYRIFAPLTEDLHIEDVPLTASGDFSPDKMRKAVHQSRIIGDVVKHYLRIAKGKLGVTFAVDVEDAGKIAQAYRAAGVPAEVITAETPDVARFAILRRFRAREVLQLVNVDLFGEGFDLPAIEVVSMARPTASYILYAQQFGRVLRPLEGKQHGIVIDHVGNVIRHGLPDRVRCWSLDRRERARGGGAVSLVPVRACPNCTMAYERLHRACPYCGWAPEPMGRSNPDLVDGDLQELDPTVLRMMRDEIERIDGAGPGGPGVIGAAINKNHLTRQRAQSRLRAVMNGWAHWRSRMGDADRQIQRRFFFQFGTDVMSAQVLGAKDADALADLISGQLTIAGVVLEPLPLPAVP